MVRFQIERVRLRFESPRERLEAITRPSRWNSTGPSILNRNRYSVHRFILTARVARR
jgi:hypothetical protein